MCALGLTVVSTFNGQRQDRRHIADSTLKQFPLFMVLQAPEGANEERISAPHQ
jgi:hypothetical protein